MKLILTHAVTNLGVPGDVVTVKDGYGRNFLIPRGLAMPWTKGGQREIDMLRAGREARAVKDLDAAKELKGQLEASPLNIVAESTKTGRLFGAVSQTQVAEAAAEAGITVDKRMIEFPVAVKTVGMHTANVLLHPEVTAEVKLNVKA